MLTTSAKVKSYLGITSATYDTLIGELIANISDFITGYTGNEIEKASFTEYFDGGRELLVKNFPIVSVTSIKYNGGTQSVPNWITIDPVNYIVYKLEGKIVGSFPSYYQNVEVIYEGGYTDVPADIELIAKQLVAKEFEQRRAQGKAKESLSGTSIDWVTGLTESQKMVLDGYSNITI